MGKHKEGNATSNMLGNEMSNSTSEVVVRKETTNGQEMAAIATSTHLASSPRSTRLEQANEAHKKNQTSATTTLTTRTPETLDTISKERDLHRVSLSTTTSSQQQQQQHQQSSPLGKRTRDSITAAAASTTTTVDSTTTATAIATTNPSASHIAATTAAAAATGSNPVTTSSTQDNNSEESTTEEAGLSLLFAASLLQQPRSGGPAAATAARSFVSATKQATVKLTEAAWTAATATDTTDIDASLTIAKSVVNDAGFVLQPATADVLCGRGGLINKHGGNIVYRRVVEFNKAVYKQVPKHQRILVSQSIVETVGSHGGRFLHQQANAVWKEITYRRAVQKTSQALRERPAAIPEGAAAAAADDGGGDSPHAVERNNDAASSSSSNVATSIVAAL